MAGTTPARPTGVTILAILSLIGGILGIFGSLAVLAIGGILGGAVGGVEGAAVGGFVFLGGLVLLGSSILALAFAYGAWTLKPWGWILGIVYGILSLVSSALAIVGGGDIGGQVLGIVIAAVILYYLNTPTVKAAFGRS